VRSASISRARPTAPASRAEATTLNMLTWSDHYANDQLKAVNKATGLQGRPTLFSDNADAYLKIKQTGSQFDHRLGRRPVGPQVQPQAG